MPVFGAAIKAQQFYTDVGLLFYLQKIVEFTDFSRLLSDFPVLFKADLISRTFQDSPLNSSTFQAYANPGLTIFLPLVVGRILLYVHVHDSSSEPSA